MKGRITRSQWITFGLILVWTTLVASLAIWNYRHENRHKLEIALLVARDEVDRDLAYQNWVASHGGVYVEASEATPSNERLNELDERHVTTPSGRVLSLISSAEIHRQIVEQRLEHPDHSIREIGIKPRSPRNGPDDWERIALANLLEGAPEYHGVEQQDGVEYFRFVRPLRTRSSCLRCHADQEFKVGDLQGGISIQFPMEQLIRESHLKVWLPTFSFSLVGLVGVIALLSGSRAINQRIQSLINAEKALSLSEEHLHLAIAGSQLGTWDMDIPSKTLTTNERCLTMLGYEPGELEISVDSWRSLIHPEDRESTLRDFVEHLHGQVPAYTSEHRLRHKDGSWIWVLESGKVIQRSAEGKLLRAAGTVKDITHWKIAEEKLRVALAREENEKEAVANLSVSPCVAEGDLEGFSTSLTKVASEVLEVERVGVWLFQDNGSKLVCLSNYQASQGKHTSGEVLLMEHFEQEFEVLSTRTHVAANDALTDPRTQAYAASYLLPLGITSLLDAVVRVGGEVAGVLCCEHVDKRHEWEQDEITFACQLADQIALVISNRERRRAEKDQARLASRLREAKKMEAIGQLAGGIAHDFNNLLQVVDGHIESAQAEIPPDSPAQTGLTSALAASNRGASLLRQLLAFGRRQIMRLETLELLSLIREATRLIEPPLGSGISVSCVSTVPYCHILADKGMLEQVLLNLSLNARDAMPSGGTLTFGVDVCHFGSPVFLGDFHLPVGNYARLTVADNGCGMDEATRGRIFEPFFTTKDSSVGTGLGLAMVHGAITQHRGAIEVESDINRGTKFRIYLPMSAELARNEPSRPEEAPQAEAQPKMVLLADDNNEIRKLIERILVSGGYRVLSAQHGREAVELFKANVEGVSGLILDVIMPEMGGRQVFEEIRRLKPDIPAIFISGYSEDAIHTDFVLDQGLRLLQKPFKRTELLAELESMLGVESTSRLE